MADRVVAVLKKANRYVAGVFTKEGLYSTCGPRDSEGEAIACAEGAALERDNSKDHLEVLEKVFAVSEGAPDLDVSDVKLDMTGLTAKARSVIEATRRIPRGDTVSYGDLATRAGLPGAARFVGNVMATNRFSPLVPCHRVISSTGIGGYGRDVKRKIELLRLEGAIK
jgi:methylated-DNA-[protein]-cysteine S-methyltransferase